MRLYHYSNELSDAKKKAYIYQSFLSSGNVFVNFKVAEMLHFF